MKRFIFTLLTVFVLSSSLHAERIWEDMTIRLNSGNYIWATLDRKSGCYEFLVGSNSTNIGGVASEPYTPAVQSPLLTLLITIETADLDNPR